VQSGAYCDGLYLSTGILDEPLARMLRETRFPHITNDHSAERLTVNTVRPHFSEGIRQAIEHLVSLGHERIGIFGMADSYRFPLIGAALALQGIVYNPDRDWVRMSNLPLGSDFQQLRTIAARDFGAWLSQKNREPFTAFICHNDLIVMGVIDAMRERGLAPGRDISIVGVDNLEQRVAEPIDNPIITTVDNPMELVGRRMGELLLNQILHGQNQIVHERIPAPLIVRQTTGPAPQKKGG
jgi:LacI family transcriptional regulator